MIPFVDIKQLRSSGYSIKTPFKFHLKSENQTVELVCTRAARILPGKRLVCFGDLNDQQVIAKFYFDTAGARRHYSRELKGVKAFQDCGIKTPALISAGKSGDAYVLCFQRIVPAEDLYLALEKQKDDSQKIRLLSLAIRAVAEQHEAGLKQNDLHRENFLVSGEDVYSIDGDAVDTRKMGKPLSEEASLKNLGLFFTHLYPFHKHLIYGVFKCYAEKRGWCLTDDLYGQLIKEIQKKKNRRKNDYLKKIFRECTEFVCQKKWDRFMVCNRESYSKEMSKLLDDPDHYMNSDKLLKSGNTATLAIAGVGGRDVVIKRYNIKNFWHGLKRFFRPSRAWVSWRNSHLLTYMNIPTPRPIALIEKRWGPFRRNAYFLTEYDHGKPLNHLFDEKITDEVDIKILLERLCSLINSLADAMIGHGDYKASNFMVSKDDIKIVDLDVMKEYRSKWKFRRALKRDMDRFMKNWSDFPEIEREFKKILSEVNK